MINAKNKEIILFILIVIVSIILTILITSGMIKIIIPEVKDILKYLSSHPDIDLRIKEVEKNIKNFNEKEYKFDINWLKIKRSLPSIFDNYNSLNKKI